MSLEVKADSNAPTASVELVIRRPLPDFDLEKVEAATPREIDPILASQGFKDLLDEARSILDSSLPRHGLEIAQLTGAICHDANVFRPGIWLVLRESGARAGAAMSDEIRARIPALAEELSNRLGLS